MSFARETQVAGTSPCIAFVALPGPVNIPTCTAGRLRTCVTFDRAALLRAAQRVVLPAPEPPTEPPSLTAPPARLTPRLKNSLLLLVVSGQQAINR